ncbi:septation ring formation regulator EzrA [Lentilactobacillus hilgardii]|uniref:Septation ring formation regulator EzrA n=5 Tax=Lentilactobacillus hilgardii TaxID=1588 RepID=A0A6P1E6W9_LENHI|nr:septation ring formation regulator EzrA [Lentilactobacillus hilgardii]RRG10119.1 MAG: septation ring formation regulator EzrA [Lactobacillus sp.]MBZ2201397.1 septation ring formation regulator EzrA [Lentilactobacillus hilgardii]MBZ2204312.1 septation ring formation regulator EzrA [Lentilactobacillus hilgardii]MCT3391109.1 septation ring formation regulator EzrA [Lentilactobacillus hilgardii]MCV3741228.1 septation ring formation regulator EzrA [Lentilactobacillus hilgardii]
MFTLLIVIIVVVGACYLGFVFYQRRTIKMATSVYESKKDLNKIPLDDEFALAKKMNLTGESKKKYGQLHNKYQHYRNQILPSIDELIKTVKEDGKGINFIKTRNDWRTANQTIQDADAALKEIQAGLAQLYDLNKQHQLAVSELEKKYKQLREDILNQNASFGPSIDGLEKMLANIEGTFDEFTKLTKSGDPSSADEVLTDLNTATGKLEDYMKRIPKLFLSLDKEFNEQLDEIQTGYTELRSKGYNFPNDNFETSVNNIRDQIRHNLDSLAKLKVEDVSAVNAKIEDAIDQLYSAIDKELKARPSVEKNTSIIGEYVDHVRRQNEDLTKRLQVLNESYVLNHQEIEDNHQFDRQITGLEREFDRETKSIDEGKAVYSEINHTQQKMLSSLKELENSQKELFDSIIDLPEKERDAQNALSKFDLEMRNKKRRIDNQNLPGLSDSYQNNFAAVIREINHLDEDLGKAHVNIDDVSKQVIIIQSDMDTLEDQTTKMLDDANLAEQTIQYANRYISSNPEIASASVKAQNYFEKQYDYSKSLSTISEALENQSSGIFSKIKNDYFNAQKPKQASDTDSKDEDQ